MLQTTANRDFLVRTERKKLRQGEIEQFKAEVDVDRKLEQEKMIKR